MQNCIRAEALNYVVINNFLLRIDTQKDRDLDKGNPFLLVIPEKYEPIIFNTYHDSLIAGHQGPYRTVMTIRQKLFIHNLIVIMLGLVLTANSLIYCSNIHSLNSLKSVCILI